MAKLISYMLSTITSRDAMENDGTMGVDLHQKVGGQNRKIIG